MKRVIHSLMTKLILSFLVLILFTVLTVFFYTYSETKKALLSTMQDELLALSSVIATQVDADTLATMQPGDENTAPFLAIRDRLYSIQKAHPDIKYIYTFRKYDENRVQFIIDPSWGTQDGGDAAKIGEVYDDTTPGMLEALFRPTVEDDFDTDKWGTFLSAYAPVRSSKGVVVGAVGVDMLAETVQKKQAFIGSTLFAVLGGALLVAALIVGVFSGTIIRDIKKLNRLADDVSTGKLDTALVMKRHDEIGDLAESFERMRTSLRILKMYPDGDGAAEKKGGA